MTSQWQVQFARFDDAFKRGGRVLWVLARGNLSEEITRFVNLDTVDRALARRGSRLGQAGLRGDLGFAIKWRVIRPSRRDAIFNALVDHIMVIDLNAIRDAVQSNHPEGPLAMQALRLGHQIHSSPTWSGTDPSDREDVDHHCVWVIDRCAQAADLRSRLTSYQTDEHRLVEESVSEIEKRVQTLSGYAAALDREDAQLATTGQQEAAATRTKQALDEAAGLLASTYGDNRAALPGIRSNAEQADFGHETDPN